MSDLMARLAQMGSVSSHSVYLMHPTIFWIDQSDQMIHFVCMIGTVSSLLLSVDVWPRIAALVSWMMYLSICNVGQSFFNHQCDLLLLESGFLLLFFAPHYQHFDVSSSSYNQTNHRSSSSPPSFVSSLSSYFRFDYLSHNPRDYHPPYAVIWLFRLLLFRVNFSRGLLHLLGKDKLWRTLSPFLYFFETQPSPTPLSWFVSSSIHYHRHHNCHHIIHYHYYHHHHFHPLY